MLKCANPFGAFVAALSFAFLLTGSVAAQKASVPKSPDLVAMGQPQVTQLLMLMETDKSGKVSKDQWMKFMAAEFDRLDKAKSGKLDIKDLKQSQAPGARFTAVGK